MKYETPELTALTAINAIQQTTLPGKTLVLPIWDSFVIWDTVVAGYADWE